MEQQSKISTIQRYARIPIAVFAGIFVGIAIGMSVLFIQQGAVVEDTQPTKEVQKTATTSLFARSLPVQLRIPKLNLEASFEAPLGLNEDKTVEVPDSYTKVGWYKYGVTPGEVGTAVVLGHVDSYEGPAVFWPLRQLKEDDEIVIQREDGTTVVYVVTEAAQYNQDNFPTEKVYKMTNYPSLRLITCIGVYDHGTQRYSHNLVVYAELKE